MSLRIFHLIFIFTTLAMSVLVGVWGVIDYRRTESMPHLALGIGAFAGGALLLWYSGWFMRKIKTMNLS